MSEPENKRKCSGIYCPMAHPFDRKNCQCTETCEHYWPEFDTSAMEALLDIAIKQFDLNTKDRDRVKALFDAYAVQYYAMANWGMRCV